MVSASGGSESAFLTICVLICTLISWTLVDSEPIYSAFKCSLCLDQAPMQLFLFAYLLSEQLTTVYQMFTLKDWHTEGRRRQAIGLPC